MRTRLLSLPVLLVLAACSPASLDTNDQATQGADQSQHAESANSQGMSADRLSNSPRHQEWVEVKNGEKTIHTFVVYPETSGPAPVVILIHENKGLNDWARGMADQIAEEGYIAVAPDLLSGFSATETRTSDFATPDAATAAIGKLKSEDVMSDLQAVAEWAKAIPASNGKLVSAGFCWGGGRSFQFATEREDLAMTMVFYGTGPEDADAYAKIKSPVVGFYGGADQRVNATLPASEAAMTAAGKTFDYEVYDGAGHAFMRSGEDPNGEAANVAARNAAWERMKQKLSQL